MKRHVLVWLLCGIFICYGFSPAVPPESLRLGGFFLGMTKAEVDKIYQDFKSRAVAEYISIERAEFRDLIQMDNEFSSMGNKIELNYDDDGRVVYIKFQYKTVDILFQAGALSAEDLVEKLSADHKIPEMKFEDKGMVKTWTYSSEELGYSLSIDDYKNVTLKIL
jgi:hypothetical protein